MPKKIRLSAFLVVALCAPLVAQWKVADKTVPRLANGQPNLSAPAPRLADGKPDLAGIWTQDPPKVRDPTVGLKPGEVSMQPWAQKLFDERKTGELSALDPDANCLSQGVPKINSAPVPFKIFMEPNEIVILYEAFGQYRQIFLDGRPTIKDPNPQWLGYSLGKWDGDTLVVESTGFNGKAWLSQLGHPSTTSLHVTERFHRRDLGHMDITATIDDPGAYTKPWTYTQSLTLLVDTELMEDVCNEGNTDVPHMKGK
ncbi:MAG TPA: hypothetical protein VGR73_19635 [Bryobacteraceae bacterium]|nr:hypothetical protein [Bryobacteraceae bacterium]